MAPETILQAHSVILLNTWNTVSLGFKPVVLNKKKKNKHRSAVAGWLPQEADTE